MGIVLRFLPFREPLDELLSVYFDFDGCWGLCLAFLATFNLCWRFRRTFLVIFGFNEGLVLRFFLHSNANGDIDASFFHQSELTRAKTAFITAFAIPVL